MRPPYRNAFGEAERSVIYELLDYYRNREEDPPYCGIYQQKFEQSFSSFMGGGFSIAVNSGSSATYVAIKALELPKGSTVLMSPVSDTSTLISILLAGLNPVIVDCAPFSYNSNLAYFKQAYSSDVSAIYLVHFMAMLVI